MNQSTLSMYLKDTLKFPVMSQAEEIKVAKQAKKGDSKAKEKLILANLRFVIQIAKQYTNSNILLIDLINEGNLGLMKAAETFDSDKGITLISYAVYWIKQSIIKAITEKFKITRIPLNANLKVLDINQELKNTKEDMSSIDFWDNLAKKLKIKKYTLIQLLNVNKSHFSFDQPFKKGENNNSVTLKDYIVDNSKYNLEKEFFKKDLKKQLQRLLKKLTPLEREIIDLRYDLNNQDKVHTLESIGKMKGYTKERIRQIEKNALSRMKQLSTEKGKWGSLKDCLETVTSSFQHDMLKSAY